MDNNTAIGSFSNQNQNFNIVSSVQDKDLIFKGNDGGSTITALTLDMSASGKATFNSHVIGTSAFFQNVYITAGGENTTNRIDNDGNVLYITHGGSNRALEIDNSTGAVTLKHGTNTKLTTTSTGALVTGFVDARHDMNATNPSGTNCNFFARDTNALAAENGGAVVFSGVYTSGGSHITGGPYIKGYKENATSNDYGFGLKLGVRENGVGNNSVAMTIDSTGDVGIGTTTPAQKLDINGSQRTRGNISVGSGGGSDYNRVDFIRAGGAGVGAIGWHSDSKFYVAGHPSFGPTAGNDVRIYGFGSDIHIGDNSNGDVITVQYSSGNVGIGTASPGRKLSVSGAIELTTADTTMHTGHAAIRRGSSGEMFLDAPGHVVVNLDTNDNNTDRVFAIRNGGTDTEIMRATESGDVGVGTIPGARFHVNASSTIGWSDLANAHILVGTTSAGIGIDTNEIFSKGSGHLYFGTSSSGGDLKFRVGGTTEAMTISGTNQRVGINKTIPLARFQVEEYGIDTTVVTSTATTQIALHSFPITSFRTARFTIQITNSTDSTYHSTEIIAVHDGTTANITEFGEVHTGSSVEATFDADINSGNFRLLATPTSTNTMQFKIVCHSITV